MEAVLISTRPQWCSLMTSGEKDTEVRKTRPKIKTPFKCFLYETKGKTDIPVFIDEDGHYIYEGRGQVIGEFVCDYIKCIPPEMFVVKEDAESVLQGSCLTPKEAKEYAGWKPGAYLSECKDLYGWHISDLVIYDKPKELSEFLVDGNQTYDCPQLTPLKRPPQSWCYVEVLA